MKFFRYRRPSWKTILGITRAKRRLKKQVGITALLKPFRFYGNQKRRVLRKLGYESEPMRMLRGGLRKPGGCSLLLIQFLFISLCSTVVAAIPRDACRLLLLRAFAEMNWDQSIAGANSGEETAIPKN